MTQVTHAYDWRGRELVDADGDKVGTVEEMFRDEDTDQPEWAAVRTGLFGTKLSFVPIQNAEPTGESVRVPFSKSQIKDAPKIDDADGQLSQQQEAELYQHYGMSYGERLRKYVVTEEVQQTVPVRREEVRVEREPITDANVDDALDGPAISEEEHEVVLHEEQPVVEKKAVPKERVRMDKQSVTDEAQVSEEVRKERIEADGDLDR